VSELDPGQDATLDDKTLDSRGERRRHALRLLALGSLSALILWLVLWQPVAVADALAWGESLASLPLTIPLLILIQALLLALALPGTLILWLVAPFYSPIVAAAILTAGSALGALGAYYTSRWLGQTWRPGPTGQRVIGLLSRKGDFWTQLILRVLPGFPHSVVNFGAGTLGLSLGPFLLATTIGLSVKWLIYASAVHTLIHDGDEVGDFDPLALLPLLALALLLAGGRLVRSRLS